MAGALLLAGCKGIPSKSEGQARADLKNATQEYRPGGKKPVLPELSSAPPFREYLRFAMLNQPKVEAAYYDWAASVERITVARSRPDPQITFQADIQEVLTSLMPGLMMEFPGYGKLRAAGEVASAESQAKYHEFESASLETAYDVRRTVYQLRLLDEKLRITRATLGLVSDLEALARAQNEVAKATLQDVLRAEIEQDGLRNQVRDLEDSRTEMVAEFKGALGLGPQVVSPPLPSNIEPTPLDTSAESLLEQALTSSHQLRSLQAEVRAAEAGIALAQKGRNPDASLGIMADVKMSPTLYRPTASVSIPLWRDKLAAQVAEAHARTKAAQARLTSAEIDLAIQFAARAYDYRQATRALELVRQQLLPKAVQALDVGRSAYLAGRTDFFNLMDTERTLLAVQLNEVEAQTQRELTLAELSLLVAGMPPSGRIQMGAAPNITRSSTVQPQMKGGM